MGTLTRLAVFVMMLTIFLVGGSAFAAPHTINLQSIIYDMDGAVTEKAFVDIIVKILDGENNVLFTEEHPDVPVVGGAVNLEIGSVNEIPLSTLDPATGTKFIDVLVDNTHPDDLMPLAAVPYSMWSEKSLSVIPDSIGSVEIKNGSIKPEDLDPSLSFANVSGQIADGQIPTVIVRQTALDAHINSTTSHPASSITLSGFFGHFVASNVQDAIKAIDQQLSGEVVDRRTGQRNLNTSLTSEVTARQGGDTVLTTNLNAHAGATAAHGSDGNVVGQNTLNTAISAHASQTTNVHGLVAGSGNLVGTDAAQTLTNKTLENPILHQGTIAGDIAMDDTRCNSEAGHACQIDGVDVGTLPGVISGEATARSSADTGLGTRIDGVNTAITTEATTRSAADTTLGGRIDAHVISSNTSAHTFGNISGIIADSQIPSSVSRLGNSIEGNEIADNTITASDLNTSSFSGWDQNAGDDLSLATANSRYASISHSHTASDVGAAPASHDHDTAYMNVGGDTMSGPLNVGDDSGSIYLSGGNFNVGRTLRNHETRIGTLEGRRNTVTRGEVPYPTGASVPAPIDILVNSRDTGSSTGGDVDCVPRNPYLINLWISGHYGRYASRWPKLSWTVSQRAIAYGDGNNIICETWVTATRDMNLSIDNAILHWQYVELD